MREYDRFQRRNFLGRFRGVRNIFSTLLINFARMLNRVSAFIKLVNKDKDKGIVFFTPIQRMRLNNS
jgi:hypothetical protein